jgi:mercuric ion transport protein
MGSGGNARLLSAGALASGIAASVCCLGPVALALTGLGGGALLLKFEPYRPYLLGVTAVFLGAAFVLAYRRPPAGECASDGSCSPASRRSGQRTFLWIVTLVVLLAAMFPYYSEWLF